MEDKLLRLRRVSEGHRKNTTWSVEKRIDAVTKYLALGNMRLVAELTGVSYTLLRHWKAEPWWMEIEAEIKASRRIQTDNKLSKIVDKALEAVGDRLENGDVFYDVKNGELSRKPVILRDALRAANDLMQRQEALNKNKEQEDDGVQAKSIQEQLTFLADEFAKFNTKRTVETVTEEIEDAVYDERETGLLEGETSLRGQEPATQESPS